MFPSKSILSLVMFLAGWVLTSQAQQKKPTLMILPSDNWCNQRYFMSSFNDQGTMKKIPNYKQAFQEDTELGQVIAKLGAFMLNEGYTLKDAEQEIKKLEQVSAEDNVTASSNSGSDLSESPLDKLKKRAKSDIIIQLWWEVNTATGGNVIRYTLDAFDAYTGKRIASSTGNSKASDKFIPDLLLKAVKENFSLFNSQIDTYFNDMKKNGREVIVKIKTWKNWDKNLEEEYDGKELNEYITGWMKKNTLQGNFNTTDNSETYILFEQTRIPLVNESGEAMDARDFTRGLQKYLKAPPFNITSKLMTRGLGEAILVLGEK
ncbi:MAG: DUF6175 family protein [Sediminibacterium sp.]|jgi:hypothetical protein|nr:DUF6175 family protein [Sediminibacterium sp.]